MFWAMRILFSVVMLAILAGACTYLYRRLVRDAALPKPWGRVLTVLAGLVTVVCVAVFLLRGRDGSEQPWALVPRIWVAAILNLLWVVLLLEVVARLYRRATRTSEPEISHDRRLFLSRAVAGAGAVTGLAITGVGTFRAYESTNITEVPVTLPGLPKALDGLTIAHLTDIHIGSLLRERFLDDLVQRANGIKPDLIVITGDLVDGTTASLGGIVARLGNLQSRYGTHFVTGNHDYYSGATAWVHALRGLGINVLRNECVSIGDAGASFDLIGVDDWGRAGDGDYDLTRALLDRDPSRASVLLAHQPANFDEVAARGVGLQLSGHTHGGQMFPATLIADAIWGARNTGLSRHLDSQIFVSRGCGFVGPAQRMGSPPEIGKIVLVSG